MSQLLIKLKQNRDGFTTKDKQQLIVEYTPLIKLIAQKIISKLPPNVDLDDLISSGVIGLMDAIEKYDPTRDNQFKTYAEFRIRGAILDELRSQDWVPRSIREKTKLLERTYRRLEQKHGRSVTAKEVAKTLKMKMPEFYDLLSDASAISLVSLDDVRQFPFQDRKNLIGMLEDMRSNNPHFQANLKDVKKAVQEALKELPENERMVMALYYYEDLNLKEIGRVLNVTESRISQIHSQAVVRLKMWIQKKIADMETA